MNRTTPQVKGTSRMPVLTEPTPRVHASFVEAIREYREEGRYSRLEPEMLAGQDQFGHYLDLLRADARPGVLRRRYRVPPAPVRIHGPMGEQRRRVRSVDVLSLGSFALLGLPDGMLGTAWPSMRATFGAPVGGLGLILLIGTTSLAALGPAVTVLALIVVAFELVLNRLAPVHPH